MANGLKPAWELEVEARAINATDWQPPPGMVKKQCSQCRYWFAAPIAKAEATSRCPQTVLASAAALLARLRRPEPRPGIPCLRRCGGADRRDADTRQLRPASPRLHSAS